jgi:hypothetical protein
MSVSPHARRFAGCPADFASAAADRAAAHLPPVLLGLGWLNGSAAVIVPGTAGDLFGVGLLAPFTLWIVCSTLIRERQRVRLPVPWPTGLFAISLLIPSSVASCIATALYASYLAVLFGPPARYAAGLAGLLAVSALWSGLGAHLVAAPLLTLDAIATQRLLAALGVAATRAGNIVTSPTGHQIVIFVGCATAFALPVALSASAALALRDATRLSWRLAWSMLALALAFTAVNVARLAFLAMSERSYEIGHGPLGRNLLDGVNVVLIIGGALLARTRPEQRRASPAPARGATIKQTLLAFVLAAGVAGLGLKIVRYAAPPLSPDARAEAALERFLAPKGWLFDRRHAVIAQSGYSVLIYEKSGCDRPLSVSILTGAGESISAVKSAMGADSAFLYDGALLAKPPRVAPINLSVKAGLSAAGLPILGPMPPLAVAPVPPTESQPCAPPPADAWALLTLDP